MRLKNLDLVIALLLAAINVVWAFLPTRFLVVSIICSLPLVFIVPGYTLTEALFKHGSAFLRKPDTANGGVLRPITAPDRLILCLGLSVAIVIINGLVLNMLPMGLDEASWAVSLAILTAVFSLIALFRRRGVQASAAKPSQTSRRLRITFSEGILSLLALVIIMSSTWYAVSAAEQPQPQSTFTQFWVVPSKQANNSCAVLVGIQNFESAPVTYNVVVTANRAQVATWSAVALSSQARWYQSVSINSKGTNSVYIVAQLYRTNKPSVLYREVHLTLNSSTENGKRTLMC